MATSAVTINSTDQDRQGFQYSTSVDGLMKNVYIPALNNTIFRGTPLMQMFGDFGGKFDFVGNKAIKAFKHQGAGGFGGIPEGGEFVTGRQQNGFQGAERLRYLNAFTSLTGPAAATVREGVGAYVDAISSSMQDTLDLASSQMERMLAGAGTALLCTFTSDGTAVDSTTGDVMTATAGTGGYSPVQHLREGMIVDVCDDAAGNVFSNGGDAIVSAINYEDGEFTLKAASTSISLSATTYYLTLANSYGDVEKDGGVTAAKSLEINGLYNLIDNGDTYDTIWGLTRSTYPHSLQAIVKDANSAELDEELLIGYIMDLVNYKQNTPNVLVTDPKSRLNYFSNRKDDRRFNTTVIDTTFGFRSIGVALDNYELILQSLASMTPGTLFLMNTSDFSFAKATDGFKWLDDGGRIFRNYESKDGIFATAVNYCQFVCENPNGHLKATDISTS